MSPAEFHALCARHDWYYSYSDDHSAWRRGASESAAIQNLVREQPELEPIYRAFISAINERKPLPKLGELLGE